MIKRSTFIVMAFALIANKSLAQFTQMELASGLKKTDFTSFTIKPLGSNAQYAISTLAFLQKYHQPEDQMFDEVGVQTTLFRRVSSAISIGPGLYFNSFAGFFERLSLSYSIQSSNIMLTVMPTIAHAEKTGTIDGEMFLQIQFTPSFKGGWKFLLSTQMLTSWKGFSNHNRSFQQLRAGFSKQDTQFGLAIDLDQYGDSPITRTSLGLFIRRTF